jgi:hypothetical protein
MGLSDQPRTDNEVRPSLDLPGLPVVLAPSRLLRRSAPAAPPTPPRATFRGVPMFSLPKLDRYDRALADGFPGAPSSARAIDTEDETASARAGRARGEDRRP